MAKKKSDKHETSDAKSEIWKQENARALKSSNDWVEKNGLPLDRYRQF